MLEWFSKCVINWRLIELSSDCSVPTAHGPKLVTTGLIVQQLCSLWTPGSIRTWFCSYNPVLTFLFTGRDAAITMNIQCTLGVAFMQLFQPIVLLHAVRSAITAIAELLVTVYCNNRCFQYSVLSAGTLRNALRDIHTLLIIHADIM